jgi:hypothetical protein
MDLVHVRQDLESLQGGGCPKPIVQRHKAGFSERIAIPGEGCSELESISRPEWILEKEVLRDLANLVRGLDLVSFLPKVVQKVPSALHPQRCDPPFPLDPSHGSNALHRSRPPQEKAGLLPEEIPDLPRKGLLKKQRYQR